MSLHRHTVDLKEPLLKHVAEWLLRAPPQTAGADLAAGLVLLPSNRACNTLRHTLLTVSDQPSLLLPQVITPKHLEADLAARLGLLQKPTPPDDLRATLLTQRLIRLPWVAEHPEAAPGQAEELVALFDEIRVNRLGSDILNEEKTSGLDVEQYSCGNGDQEGGSSGEGQTRRTGVTSDVADVLLKKDLARVREAWRLYRDMIPYDARDRLLEVGQELSRQGWIGPPFVWVVLAGFTQLDPATAVILQQLLSRVEAHLFEPTAQDLLSRLFLTSFSSTTATIHPLVPAARVTAQLTGEVEQEGANPDKAKRSSPPPPSYYQRLVDLKLDLQHDGPGLSVQMLACEEPEEESLAVTALVVSALERWQTEDSELVDRPPRIAVATSDHELARRVAAQLRDAGVAVDDTGGIPLAHCPAGLLAQAILRSVVTDFQHGPILELLTHPFVNLRPERQDHSQWTLRFEKMIRGWQRPISGLAGYQRRAGEWDASARRSSRTRAGEMTEFVAVLGRALAPLLEVSAGRASWLKQLAAFREAWDHLAPGHHLGADATHEDQAMLAKLLERLADGLDRVADVTQKEFETSLSDFAATLGRLLSLTTVRPHRSPFLPVQITGMLEARLENYDLLVLAGLREDVFPDRSQRPLFLGDVTRHRLGLPNWRDKLALHAELFLRLLHNGREVVLTWPEERLGQPCLPSPFVFRLGLSGYLGCTRAVATPRYRRETVPWERIVTDQTRFAAETPEIPVEAGSRPLHRLSHTVLRTYRDCPYRFLLESGFGLKEEEEVIEEFRRQDYGTLIHETLRRFLDPKGIGVTALAARNEIKALNELSRIVAELFGEGAESMPQRRLWAEAFLAAAPSLVSFEVERWATGWRPAILEGEFKFALADLRDWIIATATDAEVTARETEPSEPFTGLPSLEKEELLFPLTGKIDRIDVQADRSAVAVIDYKTGTIPLTKDVAEGKELQIILYALAVESGGVQGLDPSAEWRVSQGAYYGIKTEKSGFRPDKPHLPAGSPKGRHILYQGAREIMAAALAGRDRNHPYSLIPAHWRAVLPGRLPCGVCPFQAVCRLEERKKPRHVAVKLSKELTSMRSR